MISNLRSLKIHYHEIVIQLVIDDIANLCVMVEDTHLVKCFEGSDCLILKTLPVTSVDVIRRRLSSPSQYSSRNEVYMPQS
jgi:hypothetical protein